MKPRTKRILKRFSYFLLGLLLLAVVGSYGAYRYAMHRIFQDTPNTLAFDGELHPVPFEWAAETHEGYTEPHTAMLIPVFVPGIPNKLYMQFDTGGADTFLRSGALEELRRRGVQFELEKKEERTFVQTFELDVAGNRVTMESGHVRGRASVIDWENPDAKNIIGSFGADFLDQKVCEIDFSNQEIRLHKKRPTEVNALGAFTPFQFKGRRIMLPANIDGSDVKVFYDSGCSSFGLLTSKYHFDRLTDPSDEEINYGANRHGESVPIHHKATDLRIKLGSADLSLVRISYAELYNALQTTVGRMVGGGFLGNKCLTESTLIIDTLANEFLVVASPPANAKADLGVNKINSHSVTESDSIKAQSKSVVPFRLTKWNNLSVPVALNRTIVLDLMFHTAVDSVSLTRKTTERFPEITLDQDANVNSWGGQSKSRFGTGHLLKIADLDPQQVSIFEDVHSGHETDGKFGPAQLTSKFLEIDFDQSEIRLLTSLPANVDDWQKHHLETERGMMFIRAIVNDGEEDAQHRFMIHSGYSGFALLDDAFVAKHPFLRKLEVIAESELKDSSGNTLATKRVSLPRFTVGETEFDNAPVSFFSGAIDRQRFSVLGGDFLKRFNLIFDFENNVLYSKQNSLFRVEYYEGK